MSIYDTRLRKYRLEAGLSQLEVALALGYKSHHSISKWELGARTPQPKQLLALSALYGRLVNDLLLPQYQEIRKQVLSRCREHNIHRYAK